MSQSAVLACSRHWIVVAVQHSCSWRAWENGNATVPTFWTYGVEMLLHELFLQRCAHPGLHWLHPLTGTAERRQAGIPPAAHRRLPLYNMLPLLTEMCYALRLIGSQTVLAWRI